MKLNRLKIHNIASLGDADIDFKMQSLTREGVFLISGNTGSGKSTILDAICLALYGTTPRMTNYTSREDVDDSSGTVKSGDPRTLLRRGTGEGYVSLWFTGVDSREYEVSFSIARARKKPDGKLQKKSWMLKETGSGQVWEKDKEIETRIREATGVDFQQFCRTTMLAQGEFTKFLASSESEKADILEKITGTDIYARMGRLINEEKKRRETDLAELTARVGHIETLSDEEVAQIHLEIEDSEGCRLRLGVEIDSLMQLSAAMSGLESLNISLEKERVRLQETFTKLNDPGFKEDIKTASDWRATAGVRSLMREKEKFGQRLTEREGRLVESRRSLQSCLLELEQFRIQSAEKNEKERKRIDSELSAGVDAVLRDIGTAQQAADQTEKSLGSLREGFDAKLLNDHRDKVSSLQSQLNALSTAAIWTENAAAEHERRQQDIKTVAELESRVSELEEESRLKDSLQSEKSETLKGWDKTLDRQKMAVADWAKEARHNLKPGDRCPVCNRVVEELPTEEMFVSLLRPVRESRDKAYTEYRQAMEAAKEAAGRLKETRHTLIDRKKTFAQDKKYEKAVKSMKSALDACHITAGDQPDFETVLSEIRIRTDGVQLSIGKLKAVIKTEESKQNEIEKKSREHTENLNKLAALRKKLGSAEKSKSEAETRLATALVADEAMVKSITEKCDAVAKKLDEYEFGNKISADHTVPVVTGRVDGVKLGLKLGQLLSDAGSIVSEAQEARRMLSDLSQRIGQSDASGGHDEEELLRLDRLTEKYITSIEEKLQKLRDADVSGRAAVETYIKEIGEKENQIRILKEGCEIDDDRTRLQVVAMQAELEKKRDEVTARAAMLKNRLSEDKKRKEETASLQARLAELEKEAGVWGHLDLHLGGQNGFRFKRVAQSYILGHLVEAANGYMSRLNKRYRLTVTPGSFVIYVEDTYMGYDRRPCSGISGGESFQVSLALALALSDIGEGLAVDTLFIDEGFGTLSGEHLQMAVETLRTLHREGGRMVGIISHVDELRERIPAQIRVVQRPGDSFSRIEM